MPRLPYTSQIDARSGRVNNPTLPNAYDAESFGAGVGRGLQALGQGVGAIGDAAAAEAERRSNEEAANAIAGFDFTPRKLELQGKAPPDGSGYRASVLNDFDATTDAYASAIGNSAAARKFKDAMRRERLRLSEESAMYEAKSLADHNKRQADIGVSTLQNKVSVDPSQYSSAIEQMNAVIDARPGLSSMQKEAMKQEGVYDLGRRRFEGLLQNANTVDSAVAIEAELQSEGWASKIKPEDMFTLRNRVDSVKRGIATQLKSVAEGKINGLKDMNRSTTLIPASDLQDMVASANAAGDPKLVAEAFRIGRSESIKASTVKLPVATQRLKLEEAMAGMSSGGATGLPKRLADAVQNTASGSGVSAGFLSSLIKREYGSKLKGDATDYAAPTDVLGPNGLPSTSAVGVGQFIESTFLGLMRDPNVAASMGVNTSGMSDAGILELRKNPEVAVAAIAALAAQNQKVLENRLGRPVADAELYMAHFLGPDGALRLIEAYVQTPDMPAAGVLPKAAEANAGVFYRNGSAVPVSQVYDRIVRDFTSVPGRVAFDDVETYERIIDQTEKSLAQDPMLHSQIVGDERLPEPGAENYFSDMAAISRRVAAKHSIPMDKMKPLRQADAEVLSAQFANASADEAGRLLAEVAKMGDMAAPAIRQLGEKDPLLGYAGAVYLGVDPAAGAQILRGQKMVKENSAIMEQRGFTQSAVASEFTSAVGGALNGLAPGLQKQIYDAALAYAVADSSRGVQGPAYATGSIENAVRKVTGGIGQINGNPTLLERGVTADDAELIVGNATAGEWAKLSVSGTPPRFEDGTLAGPDQINDEVVLQAIGGGRYIVLTEDGKPLLDGASAQGSASPFVIKLDAKTAAEILPAIAKRGDQRVTVKNGVNFWLNKMRDK